MTSGCTAIFILIVKNQVYIANAGDCKCILATNKELEGFI